MLLTIGIRRHGQSRAVPGGIPQAISAKTEPKAHSPAAAAAHSPAEAPAPISSPIKVRRGRQDCLASLRDRCAAGGCLLAPFGKSHLDHALIESFLAGRANLRERDAVAASLSFPRLGPQPPTNPKRSRNRKRPGRRRDNTRDSLHRLLLPPFAIPVRTVAIPRRRRRDLPQLWRRQR